MITTKDKCLAALTEQRRHEIKAKLCAPELRGGHEEAAKIFEAIANDYAEKYGAENGGAA